ncbi:MAG: hypothetical protein RLZZ224_1528, partial [Verrucomicrobiota bacterium]
MGGGQIRVEPPRFGIHHSLLFMKPSFSRKHFFPFVALCAALTSGQVMGQVNITLGTTSGSGSQALTSSIVNGGYTYNFGVTASAGELTLTNLSVAISRDNNTSLPVTVQVFSGLGGTGTLL